MDTPNHNQNLDSNNNGTGPSQFNSSDNKNNQLKKKRWPLITLIVLIAALLLILAVIYSAFIGAKVQSGNKGKGKPSPTPTITSEPTVTPTPSPTSSPTPTSTTDPSVSPSPPTTQSDGIWISKNKIAALPTSGPAWDNLKYWADQPAGMPNLEDQDQNNNTLVMAKALVFARTNQENYRAEVLTNLKNVIGTEKVSTMRTLALGRELAAYVIAADLIDLKAYDSSFDQNTWRPWLKQVIRTTFSDGRTLIQCHEKRPNNWGTHCGASRVAVDVYLNDTTDLTRASQVFKGWLGDRVSYSDFSYDSDLSWQCDTTKPVGVNVLGCTKDGHNIDGAFPEDMRRGASFTWPPVHTDYAWENFQGASAQAELLARAGYDAWNWENKALLRSAQFLLALNQQFGAWWATGDDQWMPWLLNGVYSVDLPKTTPSRTTSGMFGKNVGWTAWTHAR